MLRGGRRRDSDGYMPQDGSSAGFLALLTYFVWMTMFALISCLSQQYSGLCLSPTASTLPLPSVSPIGVLSANQYTYLVSLDLPTILAFSLPSPLLPVDPLPLLGSMTPIYHRLAYIPPSTGFYHPSISSYNNCGDNRSLPHTTSYFGSIGSHNLPLGARGPGNQQKHLEYIAGSG